MRLNKRPEEQLQFELCHYLKGNYPSVYFYSDPSGLRVTHGVRKTLQITRSNHAHLDLVILEPGYDALLNEMYHALIIELKAESPLKKDGEFRTDKHLKDQIETQNLLTFKGYKVCFCWTYEDGIKIINEYLGPPANEPDEFFDKFNLAV